MFLMASEDLEFVAAIDVDLKRTAIWVNHFSLVYRAEEDSKGVSRFHRIDRVLYDYSLTMTATDDQSTEPQLLMSDESAYGYQ